MQVSPNDVVGQMMLAAAAAGGSSSGGGGGPAATATGAQPPSPADMLSPHYSAALLEASRTKMRQRLPDSDVSLHTQADGRSECTNTRTDRRSVCLGKLPVDCCCWWAAAAVREAGKGVSRMRGGRRGKRKERFASLPLPPFLFARPPRETDCLPDVPLSLFSSCHILAAA